MLQSAITKTKRKNLFITDEEVQWFWQYSKKDTKLHVAIGFAIWRGLRVGEIGAINIDDFKENINLSRMNAQLEKSHIVDSFPLLKEFSIDLHKYIQSNLHLLKNGYLFPYYSSRRLPHWSPHTMDVLLGRLRSEVGKDHPQVLEFTKELTKPYQILQIIAKGSETPQEIRKYYGGRIDSLIKDLNRMYKRGLIQCEVMLNEKGFAYPIAVELTDKGKEYMKLPKYAIRYRISWHSLRRWFETRIWEKYKDQMLLRDVMRYSKAETVNCYISPYEVWTKEHIMMKDVFEEKYREFENMSHGQVRLSEWG